LRFYVVSLFIKDMSSGKSDCPERDVMRYRIATTLVAAIWLASGNVTAAECTWTPAETESKMVQVQTGETALVQVNTDVKGSFTAPAGWTTEWVAGDCFGRDPNTCGVWKARTKPSSAGSSTAHFTVSSDACDGPREWDVTVVAEAAPASYTGATWTEPEKEEVQTHARSPHHRGGDVNVAGALLTAPNLPTTTSLGWGFEGGVGVLVTRHLRLGGAFRYMQTGVPVEESLHPVAWQATETSYGGFGRILGVVTPANWVDIEIGGQVGVLALHYPQTQIRQSSTMAVETIQEETQVTPTAGLLAGVNFYPGDVLLLGLGFGCDLTLTEVRRRIGSGYGGTGHQDENANRNAYAFPFFAFRIGARL
jgi:hypothetical protein